MSLANKKVCIAMEKKYNVLLKGLKESNKDTTSVEKMLAFLKLTDEEKESLVGTEEYEMYQKECENSGKTITVTIEDDLGEQGEESVGSLKVKGKVKTEEAKMREVTEDSFVGTDTLKEEADSSYTGSECGWDGEPFTTHYNNNFTTTGLKRVVKDKNLVAGIIGAVSVIGVLIVVYKLLKSRRR